MDRSGIYNNIDIGLCVWGEKTMESLMTSIMTTQLIRDNVEVW